MKGRMERGRDRGRGRSEGKEEEGREGREWFVSSICAHV